MYVGGDVSGGVYNEIDGAVGVDAEAVAVDVYAYTCNIAGDVDVDMYGEIGVMHMFMRTFRIMRAGAGGDVAGSVDVAASGDVYVDEDVGCDVSAYVYV